MIMSSEKDNNVEKQDLSKEDAAKAKGKGSLYGDPVFEPQD